MAPTTKNAAQYTGATRRVRAASSIASIINIDAMSSGIRTRPRSAAKQQVPIAAGATAHAWSSSGMDSVRGVIVVVAVSVVLSVSVTRTRRAMVGNGSGHVQHG